MKIPSLLIFASGFVTPLGAFTMPERSRPCLLARTEGRTNISPSSGVNQNYTCLRATAESTGKTILNFKGKESFTSDPVPLKSNSALHSFFERNDLLVMLLAGTGNADEPPTVLSKAESISFQEQWTAQARIVGAKDPDPENGDLVCRVLTGEIKFPGLNVKSEAIIGTKLIKGSEDTDGPIYELVFITDQRKAKGPKLLVWIFNKLTGQNDSNDEDGKENDEEEPAARVSSLSKFYPKILKDDDSGKEPLVVFNIDSSLEIAIKFPSMLLKILPVSKEKAEEQGSASVAKTLAKDTGAALKTIVDSYCI